MNRVAPCAEDEEVVRGREEIRAEEPLLLMVRIIKSGQF
jgi:hypothetical protein